MSRRKGLNCRFSIETQVCISSSSSRLPETLPVFSANSLLQLLDYRASLNVLDHDNMDALLIRKAQLSRGYRDILACLGRMGRGVHELLRRPSVLRCHTHI